MSFDPTVCGAFSSLALENLEKLQKSCLGFKWGGLAESTAGGLYEGQLSEA